MSLEVLGQARRLSTELGATLYAVVALPRAPSWSDDDLVATLAAHGADKVVIATDETLGGGGEELRWGTHGAALAAVCDLLSPSLLLFGATPTAREVAARAAARHRRGLPARGVARGARRRADAVRGRGRRRAHARRRARVRGGGDGARRALRASPSATTRPRSRWWPPRGAAPTSTRSARRPTRGRAALVVVDAATRAAARAAGQSARRRSRQTASAEARGWRFRSGRPALRVPSGACGSAAAATPTTWSRAKPAALAESLARAIEAGAREDKPRRTRSDARDRAASSARPTCRSCSAAAALGCEAVAVAVGAEARRAAGARGRARRGATRLCACGIPASRRPTISASPTRWRPRLRAIGDPTSSPTVLVAGDRGRGVVGPAVAERLGVPLLGQVIAISLDDGKLVAKRRGRDVVRSYAAALPALVCLIVDGRAQAPRPAASAGEVESWTLSKVGLSAAELSYRKHFASEAGQGADAEAAQARQRRGARHAAARRGIAARAEPREEGLMARARKPGEAPQPPTRGPTDTPLYALLTARRFRLGASTERVRAQPRVARRHRRRRRGGLDRRGAPARGRAVGGARQLRRHARAAQLRLRQRARAGRAARRAAAGAAARRRARRSWFRRATRCPTWRRWRWRAGSACRGSCRSATAIRRRCWRFSRPTR